MLTLNWHGSRKTKEMTGKKTNKKVLSIAFAKVFHYVIWWRSFPLEWAVKAEKVDESGHECGSNVWFIWLRKKAFRFYDEFIVSTVWRHKKNIIISAALSGCSLIISNLDDFIDEHLVKCILHFYWCCRGRIYENIISILGWMSRMEHHTNIDVIIVQRCHYSALC